MKIKKVIQSPNFVRKLKKFHKNQKLILDQRIKELIENPQLGEEKKGDLKGIFVHKFKIKEQQYLLAYRIIKDRLELIMIDTRENYYRDLKNYLQHF